MFQNNSNLTQAATVANLHLYRQQQLRGAFNSSVGRFPHGISNPAAMAMFQQAAAKSGIKTLNATSFCRQATPQLISSPAASSMHFSTPPPHVPALELQDSLSVLRDKSSTTPTRFPHQRAVRSVSPGSFLAASDVGVRLQSSTSNLAGRLPLPKPNNASDIFQRNRSSSFGIY